MPTLHLMVGLPGSGKTTRARELAAQGAMRLTPDDWHLPLFGDDVAHADHDRRHDVIEGLLLEQAAALLALKVDVILDFGFWMRDQRDAMRAWAAARGAACRLHLCDAPPDVRRARVAARGGYRLTPAIMDRYDAAWQVPDKDELTHV